MSYRGMGATEPTVSGEVFETRSIDEENSIDPSKTFTPTLYSANTWAKVKAATGATKITDSVLDRYRNVEADVAQRRRSGGLPGWALPVLGAGALFLFFKMRKGR